MSVETARRLSYQEFLDFEGEDETLWYEWVDGELVVTPAAGRPHQLVAGRLGRELARLGDDAGHGLTLAQILYRVSATRARIPDLVFIGQEKLPLPREGKDLTVTPDPPTATEHRGRLPWALGGRPLGAGEMTGWMQRSG